jgi:hypothetical protein
MREITKDNVEGYLDRGVLYAYMTNGRWWRLRRNGQAGLKAYAAISEKDFINGLLRNDYFRHVDDVPVHNASIPKPVVVR